MATADGYVILDTSTGELWENRRGKRVWSRKVDAANAYNVGSYGQKDVPLFSQQDVFVVRPIRFIDMETGHYFT